MMNLPRPLALHVYQGVIKLFTKIACLNRNEIRCLMTRLANHTPTPLYSSQYERAVSVA